MSDGIYIVWAWKIFLAPNIISLQHAIMLLKKDIQNPLEES